MFTQMRPSDTERDWRRWIRWGVATLLVGALAGPLLAATDDEEEEAGVGSVVSSIPDALAERKRLAAEERGFAMLSGVTAFLGSDDNVYRSPDSMQREARGWGNWFLVSADKRWSRGDRLTTDVTWQQVQSPRHSRVNSAYGNVTSEYVRPLGRGFRLEVDGEVSRKNDDAVNIEGEDYQRDYAYWRYAAEGALVWRVSSHHLVSLGAERIAKDYRETPAMSSIDWREWETSGFYRLRLAPYHYVGLEYATGVRRYRDEPASARDGSELPSPRVERHRYRTLTASYTLPVRTNARLGAEYERSTKTDLVADYESNRSDTGRLEAAVNFGARLESRAEVSWNRHAYENMRGDGDRPLRYTLREAGLGARLRLLDPTWVFASWNHAVRETNKSGGTAYRDYRVQSLRGGVSLFF